LISIRPATIDDWPFVIGLWLDSFRDCNAAGMISMDRWYPVMEVEVKEVMARRGCRTLVACDSDDPTSLYGFVCGEPEATPPMVHYVCVKAPYRRWRPKPGIATRLLGALGIEKMDTFDYTFTTPVMQKLGAKVPFAKHQPMLARFPPGMGIRR
jgi:hypothetical protein